MIDAALRCVAYMNVHDVMQADLMVVIALVDVCELTVCERCFIG